MHLAQQLRERALVTQEITDTTQQISQLLLGYVRELIQLVKVLINPRGIFQMVLFGDTGMVRHLPHLEDVHN